MLPACVLISVLISAISCFPTTTILPETETTPTTEYFEVTFPQEEDDFTTTTSPVNTDEPIVLDLDQVVVGFKLSMDPEEMNKISKRQTDDETESSTISLKALEDSFGGLNEVATEKSRPPERKIGFYYLLDWNSFLELDDQLGTRVNLRIQPKLGNPGRFIPITIP